MEDILVVSWFLGLGLGMFIPPSLPKTALVALLLIFPLVYIPAKVIAS